MEEKRFTKTMFFYFLMFVSIHRGPTQFLLSMGKDQDIVNGYAFLLTFAHLAVLSIVMMALPLICRIIMKGKLDYKKGKKLCLWNSIFLFCLSVASFALIGISFIGGMGAIFFYFINKWLFVEEKIV